MTLLDYAKQFHNFDIFLVLIDDAGYTDEDIMNKFDVSKQRIYDARKRITPILKAIETIEGKKDMRNSDVQLIIDAFMNAFGTTKATAYDRYAAKRLHVKYEAKNIVLLINAVASLADEQYYPTINSVSQLENKLPQVVGFVGRHSTNKVIEL